MMRRKNPALTVFANPGRRRRTRTNPRPLQLSKRVYEIAYKHTDDGQDYKHDFKSGVCMELLSDGSIRIYSMTGKPLWRKFD